LLLQAILDWRSSQADSAMCYVRQAGQCMYGAHVNDV
jgi:hypothetical protein